ncbi:hypothetical protein ACLBKU_06855 [Erythrobacter sp. NE805]|uniref:hypothetical protein n=1 Tax=Erythrobacter sp. NE805 TaxID=3389875 RepID=UPI00396B09F7
MADRKASISAAPSPQWRQRFIETLASTSNVAAAAKAARVGVSRAYRTRRAEPDFAQGWRTAIAEGYLNLELEVIRRLREGDLKTANGDKFDFANAIRLIAAHRDSAKGGVGEVRDVSIAEVRASITRKIENVRRTIERQDAAKAGRG